jgi:dipeptidyl aminopeptidase/acylaminoacyl peptidase
VLIGLVAALVPAVSHASERYEPRLRFQQLRTEHFTIYFHQGEETLARRLALVAEEVHADLSERFDAEVAPRHTHVILVDQHDGANGWATPLPYNTIEITAAAPSPSSLLGYTDDWLRLVFAHEYTHVLHLDRSRGLFGGLRWVFGRSPVSFPNIFLPAWNVEGLATAMETHETGQGRLAAGEFRVIVDAAASAGRFEPPGRVSGGLVDWPGGHAPYAFGARFHEFLERRYGPGKLAELADATAGRVPYFPGGAYSRVFGASVTDLWREFEASVSAEGQAEQLPDAEVTRLTAHGFVTTGPRWTPDGREIVYSMSDPHRFPALMQVSADGGTPRRLAERYLGDRASVGDRVLVFDQEEFVASVSRQSDLYLFLRASGGVQRLTSGARVADPDLSPDGASIAAIVRAGGRADLVRFALRPSGGAWTVGRAEALASEPDTQYAGPRWSRDGTRIAAERRRLGEIPDVVVLDAATGDVVARVASEEGRVGEPEWMPDGRALIVSWERERQPFAIYRVGLDTGAVQTLVRLPGGARSPAASPDGRTVAFVGYTSEGYDLFTAAVPSDAAMVEGLAVTAADAPPPAAPLFDGEARAYSPLGTLLPRFWIPLVETDEGQVEVGAATLGYDALGRHAYSARATWSDRAAPDWSVTYAYDRWRPMLFVSAGEDAFEWREQLYRETTFDAGATLRFRTVRRTQTLVGALHATREDAPERVFDRRSIRAAYQYSSARRFGYSISPEEGFAASIALEAAGRALGADASGGTATADLRAYSRLGGRHLVLALRAAGGGSWGDRDAHRVLGAGGPAAPGGISFGRDAVGLARGFSTDAIAGDHAVVLNADYRVPILTAERGFHTWPIFLRQVHGAVFVDAAHAWTDEFDAADARLSGGAELAFDVVLGHYLPLTLVAGLAARHDPIGVEHGAVAFARVGYAF